MKCPHCNQEHPEGYQFCPETGKKIELLKACENPKCPDFGRKIWPIETKYCPSCGRRMGDGPVNSGEEQYKRGIKYYTGEGAEKNLDKAIACFQEAAKQGYTEALCILGALYTKGEGVEKNLDKAISYFREAANQGDANAQYVLGFFYMQGDGVEKDIVTALSWLKRSAEKDHVTAQYTLGCWYENGEGITSNPEKAIYWYKRAAEQGYEKAMLKCRRYHYDGGFKSYNEHLEYNYDNQNKEASVTGFGMFGKTKQLSIPPFVLHDHCIYQVVGIADNAFKNSLIIESVDIPKSVKEIGKAAFICCQNLLGIELPEGITEIKAATFNMCTKLTTVKLPIGLKKIGDDAFRACYGLQEIVIPDGTESIGCNAFKDCKNLSSVSIPSSVTHVYDAFCNCTNLHIHRV